MERDNATIPSAEEVLRRRGPRIDYHPSQPHYSPADDIIYLPGLEQFESSAAFYSVAFHELTHWTGGRLRLARPEIINYHIGEDIRSREELTAEMGAAFFCQLCALDSPETMENSTAYIQSWLKSSQRQSQMGSAGQQTGPRRCGVRPNRTDSRQGGSQQCSQPQLKAPSIFVQLDSRTPPWLVVSGKTWPRTSRSRL